MDLKIYSCGPTVYDYAHIGNWRSFIMVDLLKRSLLYSGQSIKHIMNITDVDDKTITASQKAGIPLSEYTKKYEELFLADAKSLNILPPDKYTRATDYIPQMVDMIEKLLEKGNAYKTSDGVYFSVASFPSYGQLSKRPIEASEGRDDESHDKKDKRDFALWKFQTPADGEVGWEASFGKGRPGWHIECSAMSITELGETLDYHTGGSDLLFPHHENEVAQSESLTGKPFVKNWLHNAFVNIDGQKMSKSLGNIYTLRDLEAKGITPLAYRLWLLMAHYSTPVNFTWEAVAGAQTLLEKIQNRFLSLPDTGIFDREKLVATIGDDLNLPQTLALAQEQDNKAAWLEFDKILGLGLADLKPLEIPADVQELVNQREAARQAQDWAKSDELRAQIEARGYSIKDTETGPTLTLN